MKRRFTHTGDWNGVAIYDDYGHHPVEIAAVLQAARSATNGRLVAVVQPHRYTRLKSLFAEFCTCFNEADTVIVADVYPAGEAPIEGANRDALVEGLRSGGHRDARALRQRGGAASLIAVASSSRATWWSASAPDRSRAGRTRCRRRCRMGRGEEGVSGCRAAAIPLPGGEGARAKGE